MSRSRLLAATLIVAAGLGCVGGCESGPSAHERQDRALADPMHYKVNFDNDRVSGGGIGSFDKDGFKRDVKNVLNP